MSCPEENDKVATTTPFYRQLCHSNVECICQVAVHPPKAAQAFVLGEGGNDEMKNTNQMKKQMMYNQ